MTFKNIFIYLVILIVSVLIVTAFTELVIIDKDLDLDLNKVIIGDDVIEYKNESFDGINITAKYEKMFIGYENVYKNITEKYYECTYDNKTRKEICGYYEREISVIDESKKGVPIYKTEKIKTMTFKNNLIIDTDKNSCWTCNNTWVACLDNTDGGTSVSSRHESFKCDESGYPIIRDGETGVIRLII